MLSTLVVISLAIAAGVIVLPWRPWSTRETLDAVAGTAADDPSDTTVLIPARNEAASAVS
jgi:hypothetical protein